MRTSALYAFVALAVGASAGPTLLKRDDATPVLEAREPAFSINIPNNIPVSGVFPNGINITQKAGGGSIVSGNNNSTLFGKLFGFKRDESTPTHQARAPAFSVNIPNNVAVSGALPDGLTITHKEGGGSIITGPNNATLFGSLFGRDESTPTHQARAPAFSLNIPNDIAVSGALPDGLTVTPKAGGGSIITGPNNATLFVSLFGRDVSPTVQARAPAFSLNIPNDIAVSGALPDGLTITHKEGGGSIITGPNNATLFGSLFGRDESTPTHQARAPAFSLNIPNDIAVSGALPNGLTVTPKAGGGSIITGPNNATLFGSLFGRDESTPTHQARAPAFSLNIPNDIAVSGAFPNGLNIAHKAGGGSIVTGQNNSTLFGSLFGFKRDE